MTTFTEDVATVSHLALWGVSDGVMTPVKKASVF